MTKRECAIVMAYTGVCMLKGDDLKHFYSYVSELMDRTMLAHEIGEQSDTIKEAAKDDFINLCATATDGETTVEITEEPVAETLSEMQWCINCAFYDKYTANVGWCGNIRGSVGATRTCNMFKKKEV
ncbi:MAG: hypothetical protein J6U54_01215 [Clostridiales bacterium]|nr:hypothetical protein [Clostridiales bacterium]